ncbi:hypothetical protein [uncultured Sunxiuqinia sp.]|uniref:hypothetical protein n=1 Tax=uncultured Sunxiuqinia sp. TaxID=1573825 RepID=UPI0030DDB94C|tara:strand:+ start:2108 stop:2449 length:342 start_codon:yes stop_codon:yes gene_type:complete
MKKGMIMTAAVIVLGISMPSGVMAESTNQTMQIAQEEVQYEKMNVEDLPEAVTQAISEGYADYTLSEAYMGTDGSYKVKLTKEEEKIAVFFNASGEFLKIEQGEEPAGEVPVE